MERKVRSAIKSIIWRIVGVIVLAAVTFFYTRNWIQTSWVTFLHHGIFLFVFYINERFWLHVDYKKPFNSLTFRSIAKCITYETVLGTLILGIITLIITGDVQQMGKITITYMAIKHLIYVFNEYIWSKIKWATA